MPADAGIQFFPVLLHAAAGEPSCAYFQFSNSLSQRSAARILGCRPRVGPLPFLPSQSSRGWSAAWRYQLVRTLAGAGALMANEDAAPRGAPWRRFLSPGSALPGNASTFGFRSVGASSAHRLVAPPVLPAFFEAACPASSLRRGRSAPRSGPQASRVRGYEPRARAPRRPKRCRFGSGRVMPHLRHRPIPAAPPSDVSRRRPSVSRTDAT